MENNRVRNTEEVPEPKWLRIMSIGKCRRELYFIRAISSVGRRRRLDGRMSQDGSDWMDPLLDTPSVPVFFHDLSHVVVWLFWQRNAALCVCTQSGPFSSTVSLKWNEGARTYCSLLLSGWSETVRTPGRRSWTGDARDV